ncbi:type I-C CRISPR-associated protein Cas8c/Csd1 [Ramlibacter sp.]|uniref:type I-C CRISPR-associated protein Cas8c/Csd1 n=1 Tax=Ramlibacter sp. TaxID=1917967 RepID=UPI00179075A3|nr:type I-C CRISPR-associated protein Cas8c/Csd1 [Ramlibacter sp.]MBA2673043.1 type I-C CRISPR-associated protein Cas8c/Csd1 [Ramlibacter sp.]
MILQALDGYYRRLLASGTSELSAFGYSPEKISYAIVLQPDGSVLQIDDLRDGSGKKPVPIALNVPQPAKRTVGIKSNFLWDKTSYVLGVSVSSKRADREHEAFKALHRQALVGETDTGIKALLAFLDTWKPEAFQPPMFKEEMLDANMVFRFAHERGYLHDRPAAKLARARLLAGEDGEESDDAPVGTCLVSGERGPVARLHAAIKGVNGAQSSGASIVSFNLDAFTSYGKIQGENAPVSVQAAFAYTTALNHLLRRGEHNRQRLQVGDTTVVFWAEADDPRAAAAAELTFASLLNPPPSDAQESQKVRVVLEAVAKGRPLHDIDPGLHEGTRMFVLGLAPNASRLSVRYWQVDTLDVFAQQLAWHARDLRIEPLPWKTAPETWRLALSTAPTRDGRGKSDDVPPQLAGELLRSILTGRRYPGSLLANLLMRMRADGDLSGIRVALCKGVLARNLRLQHSKEEVPVSLDKQSPNPAYRLGRLFAVLESAQRLALGGQVNATIRDRYYGAASATPAAVFPMLLRNTQNHLGRLRKDKPGMAVNLERDIRDIVDGLQEQLPRSLRIEDQGRFAIGYYHQSQARFASKGEDVAETETGTTATNE